MKQEVEGTLRTLKKENSMMRDQMLEMEERLAEVEATSERQAEINTQKTQLAQEALKKCKEDLRRVTQDLGYKRSALNRVQEVNVEYEVELRELRTLKENSGNVELLNRELSGLWYGDIADCRSYEMG
jgi:DNA repair exonuclease SbcCD ATPase subunit